MQFENTFIDGLVVLTPKVFHDDRGSFFESYHYNFLNKHFKDLNFVQDNEASSKYGVVRGLHFQLNPYAQTKLVRVPYGKILDVAVDLRKDSQTYGKYFSLELSDDNKKQLLIPKGFAHGYSVLSEKAIVHYKCDEFYHPECEGGIHPLDVSLNIDWKIKKNEMIISQKDLNLSSFKTFLSNA
ncbi:MAG: dTDP-4-dehydrorhamnose 3,5-epimerase [Saprospiraceae bacterium]|nr:dTDP-4-dehydrorhamnose 3,5-epimerase [Saprospiraceae bacterium]